MKKMILGLAAIVALGLPLFMTGCSDDNASTVTLSQAVATGTITGKITDATTGAAIQGADVTLLVNDTKRATKTATSTDADLQGKYSFAAVPAGTHSLKIVMTGYATRVLTVSVGRTNDNTPVSVYANLALAKAYDQKVLVVDNTGAPISGVVVRALYNAWTGQNGVANNTNYPNTLVGDGVGNTNGAAAQATTDATGVATLAALDQLTAYNIVSLPVYGTDGKVKYTGAFNAGVGFACVGSATAGINNGQQINNGQTITLVLAPVTRSTTLAAVATNLYSFTTDAANAANANPAGANNGAANPATVNAAGANDAAYYLTSKTASVIVAFNLPVTLDTANLTISYLDYLQAGPQTATLLFNNKVVTPATVPTVTTENILTIPAPTAGYKVLQSYTVNGGVRAAVNAGIDQAQWGGLAFCVTDDTTKISTDGTTGNIPYVDNFNSSTGGTVYQVSSVNIAGAGGSTQNYLVFSEPVYGTYRIVATQVGNAASESILNTTQIRINGLASGNIVWAPYTDGNGSTPTAGNNTAGTGTGSVFRLQLPGNTPDDATGNINKLRIYLDVVDTHGNALRKEITFGVK